VTCRIAEFSLPSILTWNFAHPAKSFEEIHGNSRSAPKRVARAPEPTA